MKIFKALILTAVVCSLAISCFEDKDDNGIFASEINDFVWKGMNGWYLYKDNVPDLANNRFSSDGEYANYLNAFSSPEDLFESLIYQRENVDRFSWITDDYIANEQFLNGTTLNNGMEYKLYRFTSTDTNLFGAVVYVLPNTSAETQGIQRGDIFYAVDGTQLTVDNWTTLLDPNTYTINLGTYNTNGTSETSDDSITPTENVTLTKAEYTEDPILVNSVLNVSGNNIGYLMYNGFNGSSSELNDVFGTFKSAGITDLVLDLRYNPGGFVSRAVMVSSLITGQFTGEIHNTEQWNSEIQAQFESDNPEFVINRFTNSDNGMSLNSLNLDKVYILTTRGSASASELVINSLRPYIQVIQIGTKTYGKYQASLTVYDSPPDYITQENANPNHTYALQPLVYKSLNVNGLTDYFDGLTPDITVNEKVNDLGVLGDENETLLAAAIADITGSGRPAIGKEDYQLKAVYDSNDLIPHSKDMISDKEIPKSIIKQINFSQ